MTNFETELDDAIAVVQEQVSDLGDVVLVIIDKLNQTHGVDLSDETASLKVLADKLTAANDALNAAASSDSGVSGGEGPSGVSGPEGETGDAGVTGTDVPVEPTPFEPPVEDDLT